MPRFKADARRLAVVHRLEREAVEEARIVLDEHSPRLMPALAALERQRAGGWIPDRPGVLDAYMVAGQAAERVLDVYVTRILHVENGVTR
jgi:hypothetical protein